MVEQTHTLKDLPEPILINITMIVMYISMWLVVFSMNFQFHKGQAMST